MEKKIVVPFLLGAALALAGCESTTFVGVAPDPPDAGCVRAVEPRHYEVFFVLDVSGSMIPFLTDVKDELAALAAGFPSEDSLGRGIRVDYYVIAFVNDYKVFGGGRMSSTVALGAALQDAITAGSREKNLTQDAANVEPEENLLDALSAVPDLIEDQSSTKIVLIATDADFVESPALLNQGLRVQSTFTGVRQMLAGMNARVALFTRPFVSGLNQPFKTTPPLSELPNASSNRLDELQGARQRVGEKLNLIARSAVCG